VAGSTHKVELRSGDHTGQCACVSERDELVSFSVEYERGRRNVFRPEAASWVAAAHAWNIIPRTLTDQLPGNALYACISSRRSTPAPGAAALCPPAVVAASTRVRTWFGCRIAISCATMPPNLDFAVVARRHGM
jgi:hypothetical protein